MKPTREGQESVADRFLPFLEPRKLIWVGYAGFALLLLAVYAVLPVAEESDGGTGDLLLLAVSILPLLWLGFIMWVANRRKVERKPGT